MFFHSLALWVNTDSVQKIVIQGHQLLPCDSYHNNVYSLQGFNHYAQKTRHNQVKYYDNDAAGVSRLDVCRKASC